LTSFLDRIATFRSSNVASIRRYWIIYASGVWIHAGLRENHQQFFANCAEQDALGGHAIQPLEVTSERGWTRQKPSWACRPPRQRHFVRKVTYLSPRTTSPQDELSGLGNVSLASTSNCGAPGGWSAGRSTMRDCDQEGLDEFLAIPDVMYWTMQEAFSAESARRKS